MAYLPLSSLEAIYSQTCSTCGGGKPKAAADPDKLSALFEDDIKRISAQLYASRGADGSIDIKSARKAAAVLSRAILKGYGEEFPKIDFDSPDSKMYRSLEHNVFRFSFAKNYEQMKAVTLALHQGDKVVPYEEFKGVVSRINQEYNVRFLRTEYDTAIGSAQMASRWVQYQDEADDIPLLTYVTVGDSRVRPTHAAMDGTCLPITDGFWKRYYPPNGWNCRCDVIQSPDGKATPHNKVPVPDDVPPLFRTNFAQDGLAFPPDSPFFEHVPDDILQLADRNNPFLYERLHEGKRSGSVWASPLHGERELADNLEVAKILADRGNQVILLPELKADTEVQRALRKMTLNPDTREGKNPDATINGEIYDIKVLTARSKSAVHNAIESGSKQAGKLVIQLPKGLGETNFKRYAKGKLLRMSSRPEEIWLVNNGKLKKFGVNDLL